MEPQDIAGLLELGICAAVGYLPMVTAAGYVTQSSLLQERIKSQKHLEEVINEEALKLGLEDQKFRATFPAEFNGFVFDEDHYHICIKDGMMGTCAVVRNPALPYRAGRCWARKDRYGGSATSCTPQAQGYSLWRVSAQALKRPFKAHGTPIFNY